MKRLLTRAWPARGLALAAMLAAAAAQAHPGHGAEDPHWHATDAWGFIAVVVAIAAAMWWRSRK